MNLKGFYFLDFLSFSFGFRKTKKGDPRGGGGVDGQKMKVLLADHLGSALATSECCWRTEGVRQQLQNIAGVPPTGYASNKMPPGGLPTMLAYNGLGTPAICPQHWRTKRSVRQQRLFAGVPNTWCASKGMSAIAVSLLVSAKHRF